MPCHVMVRSVRAVPRGSGYTPGLCGSSQRCSDGIASISSCPPLSSPSTSLFVWYRSSWSWLAGGNVDGLPDTPDQVAGNVAGLSVMSSHDADPTSGAGPSSYCPLDKLNRGHTSSPDGGVSVQSDRSDVDKLDCPDSSAPTRWYSSAESGSIR